MTHSNRKARERRKHSGSLFFRKSEGFIEGSGLGLAIVKGIIDQHGGTVGARNKAEGGAVFSFTLPASTDARPIELYTP